jgi:hippurate hydrolase
VAEHLAAAHGCRAEVDVIEDKHIPVTVNDARAVDRTLAVAQRLIGPEQIVRMPTPVMEMDDWSYVLQQAPGSMAFLGAAPPGVTRPAPNHSNRMVLDETVMATGIAINAAMALS